MFNLRSKITRAVLGYFMLHEKAELYVSEMARRLLLDQGNLTRKLSELEREGILESRMRGKERYYALNASFPLLQEYRQIILKTTGFEPALKKALEAVEGLKEAYLFGSYARNQMDVSSDIDLLAIGDHNAIELQKKIAKLQKSTDREINVISMNIDEFQKRRKTDSFIRSVIEGKKIQIL
jgi:predicted nucleotidyltransferase